MTVRPRRSLSKCQEDRHSNTEKGDGNTTSNGNVVRVTYRRRAAARERGSLSHSPEQQATNQLWSTRGNKTGFIDEAHQFFSWRNMPWLAFLNKERIQEKQGSDDAYFKRSLTKKGIPWCTTIKKRLKTTHEPKLDSPEWVIRFHLANRRVAPLPTCLAHGVPGINCLMTQHPTTRQGHGWIGRLPLKRP